MNDFHHFVKNGKRKITDRILQNLYSSFDFKYEKPPFQISQYLDEFQYHPFLIFSSFSLNDTNYYIFCFEERCLFFQENQETMKIVDNIKTKLSITIFDLNEEFTEVFEETNPFVSKFSQHFQDNLFVTVTIRPLFCYMVRRFFFKSKQFQHPSFFTPFHNNEYLKYFSDEYFINKYYNTKFHSDEFLKLRKIEERCDHRVFLGIHLESFYVVALKEYKDDLKYIDYENLLEAQFYHNCILPCYGFFRTSDNYVIFVYEFMSNGQLSKQFDYLDGTAKTELILRMLYALSLIHKKGIIHGGINPDNIFFDHDFIPYLGYFTNSKITNDFDFNHMNDVDLINSSDPKMLFHESMKDLYPYKYDIYKDIFSLGIIFYFLCSDFNTLKDHSFDSILKNSDYYKTQILSKPYNKMQNFYDELTKNDNCEKNANILISLLLEKEYFFPETKKGNILQIVNNNFYLYFADKNPEIPLSCDFLFNNTIELFYKYLTNDNFDRLRKFYSKHSPEKEKECLELQCKDQDPRAYLKLGDKFLELDINKALKYYIFAAEHNYKNSNIKVANILYLQLNNPKDSIGYYEKEIKFGKNKADKGDAMEKLGEIFWKCPNLMNQEKGLNYLNEALKFNNEKAFTLLVQIYSNEDRKKAKKLINFRLKKNENYNEDYFYKLGNIYQQLAKEETDKSKVSKKAKKAIENYKKVKNDNMALAQFNIGLIYYKGVLIKADYKKAIKYFTKAANNKCFKASLMLGMIYYQGVIVSQDLNHAKKLLSDGIKCPDISKDPDTEFLYAQANNYLGLIAFSEMNQPNDRICFQDELLQEKLTIKNKDALPVITNFFQEAMDPKCIDSIKNIGLVAYYFYGNLDEALKCLKYASEKNLFSSALNEILILYNICANNDNSNFRGLLIDALNDITNIHQFKLRDFTVNSNYKDLFYLVSLILIRANFPIELFVDYCKSLKHSYSKIQSSITNNQINKIYIDQLIQKKNVEINSNPLFYLMGVPINQNEYEENMKDFYDGLFDS